MTDEIYSYGKMNINHCSENNTYSLCLGGRMFTLSNRSLKYAAKLKGDKLKEYLKRKQSGIIPKLNKEGIDLSQLEKAFVEMSDERPVSATEIKKTL